MLDNAKIHHGDDVLALADRFNILIEYLPPYFPDLNPIKKAFSKIKHFIRRNQDYYRASTDDGILYDMYEVLEVVTGSDAAGYFGHAGYF